MTPEQVHMARHALGLDGTRKKSFRNSYIVAVGSTHDDIWRDMASQGMAERGRPGVRLVGYCLTRAGAKAVLRDGEKLDPEDFPEERR